jgi:putative exosortase-associated protein (TIGR04073 family)
MRKAAVLTVVFMLIAGFMAQGFAEEMLREQMPEPGSQIDAEKIPYGKTALNKLERGSMNMATFWMELPASVARVSSESNPVLGVTVGAVNGVFTSAIRGLTAIFDVTTFMIPSYSKPVMKPEYAINSLDTSMRNFLW